MTDDLTDAPAGMPYRRYWDGDEHLEGLRAEIQEVIAWAWERGEAHQDRLLAEHVADRLFKRVKLRTWCSKVGCFGESCTPTHYAFDLKTHLRRFGPEVES